MKAYQLKVIIKDAKPPLWWRFFTPAGITFSSLSLLLDAVTGQEKENRFQFVFYQKARIFEPDKLHPLQSDYWYDASDASGVYLDEYFPYAKSFTYTSGNDAFRVEIEGTALKYDLPYPAISKMVVPKGYDADARVAAVKDGFCFAKGKPVYLSRWEILKEAGSGLIPLHCTSTPVNRENAIKESSERSLQKLGAQLQKNLSHVPNRQEIEPSLDESPEEEEASRYSLAELLLNHKKSSLVDIAEQHSIPGAADMKKERLIRELAEILREPAVMRSDFYYLTDRELRAFETANASGEDPCSVSEAQKNDFDELHLLGYVFLAAGKKEVMIPREFKEVYAHANNEYFRLKRQKIQWIMKIMNDIVPFYYGVLPFRKFSRLCRRTGNPELNADEALALAKNIPERYVRSCIDEDSVIACYYLSHPEKKENLLRAQGNKPFYIMRQNEIEELLEFRYPVKEFWYRKCRAFLTEVKGKDDQAADRLLREIHQKIALGYSLQDIFDMLDDENMTFSDSEFDVFLKIYQGLQNNTPCLLNRGYTPDNVPV